MEVRISENGSALSVEISGKIDAVTAPELEKSLIDVIAEKSEIVLDFDKVTYISSAGLRVVLFAQKTIDGQGGKLIITNVDEDVYEIFEMTGFSNAFQIIKRQ